MFLSLLLLATVVPGALAAADEAETKAHSRSDSVLVSPVEDPAVTNVLPNTAIVPDDPKQVLQDYDSLMIAHTEVFCHTRDDRRRCQARRLKQRAGERNECRAIPTHPHAV